MSNAAVEQCYYPAREKCDIQLSFPVFRSAHIALLNQAIRAGTRGTLFCLTPETWCCYSERRQSWKSVSPVFRADSSVCQMGSRLGQIMFDVLWSRSSVCLKPSHSVSDHCSSGGCWNLLSVSGKITAELALYLTFQAPSDLQILTFVFLFLSLYTDWCLFVLKLFFFS